MTERGTQGSEGLGIVGEPVPHVRGDDRLLAMVANDSSVEIVSAGEMLEQERRLSPGKPAVAPSQHGDEGTVEIAPHVGEEIFVAVGRTLILPPIEHAARDEAGQPIGQDVRGNLKFGQDLVVAPIAEKGFAHDHEAPFVANDLQGSRNRARASEQESASVGGPSGITAGFRGMAAGTRSVPVLHIPRTDAFPAMGARDQRVTIAAATHVDKRQGSWLAASKPAIAELHQGDKARIEIKPHFGESILLPLRGAGRDLTEDRELRQLLQTIRERRPRDAERGTEGLECLRPEKRLADDQKRPCVRDDVESAGDRAVAFTPRDAGMTPDRPRSRSGRCLGFLNLGGGGHLRQVSLQALRSQAVSKGALV